MSEPRRPRLDARLAALRADFVAGLPGRRTVLAEALASFAAGSGTALAALQGEAHKLAGTAPLLGLPELGAAGAVLDRRAYDCVSRDAAPDPRARREIEALARILIAACDGAAADGE